MLHAFRRDILAWEQATGKRALGLRRTFNRAVRLAAGGDETNRKKIRAALAAAAAWEKEKVEALAVKKAEKDRRLDLVFAMVRTITGKSYKLLNICALRDDANDHTKLIISSATKMALGDNTVLDQIQSEVDKLTIIAIKCANGNEETLKVIELCADLIGYNAAQLGSSINDKGEWDMKRLEQAVRVSAEAEEAAAAKKEEKKE